MKEKRLPTLSKRGETIPSSPLRKYSALADQIKSKGVAVYHLNIGQPDLKTPQVVTQALNDYQPDIIGYGPSLGSPEYREALLKWYREFKGFDVDLSHLMITQAGSEALLFAMSAIASPGEVILTPEPFYTNYQSIASIVGVELRPIPTQVENNFSIPSREVLDSLVDEKVRALLITNPSNPTGHNLSEDEFSRLSSFATDHGLFYISDEVYSDFVYSGSFSSVMQDEQLKEHAVLIDSVSKRYSACGIRIGCLLSRNKELFSSIENMAMSRLCPSVPGQVAMLEALKLNDDYYLESLEEYRGRMELCFNLLDAIPGVTCSKPDGAFYIIAKLPVQDAEDFTRWMLEEYTQTHSETVLVSPMAGFYLSPGKGSDEIRIAYVLEKEKLSQALEILRDGLKLYSEKS